MAHNHSHSAESTSEKNLFITMALNFSITIAEVIGGFLSGSLSLISDALHNFSDGIAIIITYIAMRLSKKPRTFKYTFGLKRAEIIAAIINASTLIIISFFLIKEAIERFYNPSPITGSLMLIVAALGLVANVIGTLLLKKGSEGNLNIRAAYFHLLSDAVSSLAVIIGAVFIIFYKIYWIDPLLTILISIYILKETYELVKEALDVIMMSSPAGINLDELKILVEGIPGVINIHHVHLWKLNDNDTHFEAHIEVEDMVVSKTIDIQKLIEQELHERYEINHTTLQFECDKCDTPKLV
ncbi:MAG: cation transporter [Ignavibacteria bacterium CG_4_8_14_3_um_filter_37_9]|nr:cation transporter [Ignavibacteria bacterium]OIO18595.1 MAG: cation transporter [Ignavibacteria bacterium CG1_02_37_35]PIS46061.1 MAG: cation transporter [Ignavibacteria bacterium CG08_land_8_20_14_0_20_37_9]PIW99340.1 MAG: cation transporter [Ignavibacteria bacterium CG_4_8_14_3_um_filter_37_9]PIX93578.1 MAG: cation transporter [Ignavibacteria bacterium CG_4_10_14_3_um_filter_37_18]